LRPRSASAQELLQLVAAGLAREVAGRDDWDEEARRVEHLVQLARPVFADADPSDVLENLEGSAGDRAHRACEPATELGDRAAVVSVVEAGVAEKCVRRLRCYAGPLA
jgi:hypothetical protein